MAGGWTYVVVRVVRGTTKGRGARERCGEERAREGSQAGRITPSLTWKEAGQGRRSIVGNKRAPKRGEGA